MPEELEQLPQEEPERKESFRSSLYTWLQCLACALTALILICTFVGRVIGVDGSSMVPTLHNRDMILLQGIGYTPQAGDVVVLTQRSFSDIPIVKRVIATGGQTVDVDYETSTVYVDGVALDEPYLGEPMEIPTWPAEDHIEVPEGSICVFGDNRNHSTDSRSPMVGTVDARCVLGKALLVLLPFQNFGVIH